MEDVQETKPTSLNERILRLEKELQDKQIQNSKNKEKGFRFPFRWNLKFRQSKRLRNVDKILVLFLNKKNQIEPPKFMPLYDNFIIWKNKVYRYNPKAIWTMLVRGKPQVYLIREIDMEAVSNLDYDKILAQGRSTENHSMYQKAFMKALLNAQLAKQQKKFNMVALVIIVLLIAGGLIWFFTSK